MQPGVIESFGSMHLVQGPASNWVVVDLDDGCLLVDAGYPKDVDRVAESLKALGWEAHELRGILITHAHSDHLGSARQLSDAVGVSVYASERELPHVRREYTQQIGWGAVWPHIWRPGFVQFVRGAIRQGGLEPCEVTTPEPVRALSLPANFLVIQTPGHTSGHVSLYDTSSKVLVAGDLMVTAHPTVRREGFPQLLPAVFHHDPARLSETLKSMSHLEVAVLLPGHGPAYVMQPGEFREICIRLASSGVSSRLGSSA